MNNATTFDPGTLALTVKAHEGLRNCYHVARNGRILGDSRGFATVAEAEAEITRMLEQDARDAVKYERPLMYVKG